jgi:Mn-containing catalase
MYHHVKKLMHTVRVDEADPRFGNMLLEQFGGANGGLAAAMQYSIYGTARTIAGQIGLPAVAALLSKSLSEEEIADNLLTQIARELMSESRTGVTKEPSTRPH